MRYGAKETKRAQYKGEKGEKEEGQVSLQKITSVGLQWVVGAILWASE